MQLSLHFRLGEFLAAADPGLGQLSATHVRALTRVVRRLEVLREHLGRPIHVTSGWRSPLHNRAVGGSERSLHLSGRAADIVVEGLSSLELAAVIETLIRTSRIPDGGIGVYPIQGHTHLDLGARRRWGGEP